MRRFNFTGQISETIIVKPTRNVQEGEAMHTRNRIITFKPHMKEQERKTALGTGNTHKSKYTKKNSNVTRIQNKFNIDTVDRSRVQ